MKFLVKNQIRADDVATIEHAIRRVDADAKVDVDTGTNMVGVDSWLMPEEFFVAFSDEEYDIRVVEW